MKRDVPVTVVFVFVERCVRQMNSKTDAYWEEHLNGSLGPHDRFVQFLISRFKIVLNAGHLAIMKTKTDQLHEMNMNRKKRTCSLKKQSSNQ